MCRPESELLRCLLNINEHLHHSNPQEVQKYPLLLTYGHPGRWTHHGHPQSPNTLVLHYASFSSGLEALRDPFCQIDLAPQPQVEACNIVGRVLFSWEAFSCVTGDVLGLCDSGDPVFFPESSTVIQCGHI